jgi:gag-polyprotein putative aspartyl protease
LSFEDGKNFTPAYWDPITKTEVDEPDRAFDSDQFVGDLGMCAQDKDDELWTCTVMHNGQEVSITHAHKSASAEATPQPWHDYQVDPPAKSAGGPTTADANMVNVDVDVAGYQVKAMVDTGCSFPMAIPSALAAALLHDGRATFAGETKSLLADGKQADVGVIMIKSITVDGRTLNGVEASVSPSNSAPILLGLSALNRLGPFTINNGRIVFTGNQPPA